MIDKYKLAKLEKRLEKENWEQKQHLRMIYMWVKQGVITRKEFESLILYCS